MINLRTQNLKNLNTEKIGIQFLKELLTFTEYNSLVQTKRVQYQINFRSEW